MAPTFNCIDVKMWKQKKNVSNGRATRQLREETVVKNQAHINRLSGGLDSSERRAG